MLNDNCDHAILRLDACLTPRVLHGPCPELLRLQPTGQRVGAKKKGQKTKLRKDKNKGGRDKLPLTSDFITKTNSK